MAKGQIRGNKEVKKPKQEKKVVATATSFITVPKPKSEKQEKSKH